MVSKKGNFSGQGTSKAMFKVLAISLQRVYLRLGVQVKGLGLPEGGSLLFGRI